MNLVQQLMDSLIKIVSLAVELSLEMRTQRAEYIVLPPLQPEYDEDNRLSRKIYFNAVLMHERSGMLGSDEDLERRSAVVSLVLFPLVVKKGDDAGRSEEEVVIFPAQVLVARSDGDRKVVRVMSTNLTMGEGDQSSYSAAPSSLDMSNVI